MTSQQNTGTHPFYIGNIYTHIYVHKYTSQKKCLHIFVGVVISSLVCFVGGHGGMYHKDIRTLDLHFWMSIHRGSLLHMAWGLELSEDLDVWMNEQHQSWCGICCGSYGQLAAHIANVRSSLDTHTIFIGNPSRRGGLGVQEAVGFCIATRPLVAHTGFAFRPLWVRRVGRPKHSWDTILANFGRLNLS